MKELSVEEMKNQLSMDLLKTQKKYLNENKLKEALAVNEAMEQFINFCVFLSSIKLAD